MTRKQATKIYMTALEGLLEEAKATNDESAIKDYSMIKETIESYEAMITWQLEKSKRKVL